jgi:hypothetical protein
MRAASLAMFLIGCGGASTPCPLCPPETREPALAEANLAGAAALAPVQWMAGRFVCVLEREVVEESWTAPGGGTMLGVNRTIREGRTEAFEFLRIEARDEGIVYVAHPGLRNPGTEFRLRDAESARDGVATFENPDNDFPKVLIYERTESGVDVRIAGDGATTGWVFRRVGGPR